MVLIADDLQKKLNQAINYLSFRAEQYTPYEILIERLKSIQSQIDNYRYQIKIVSHEQKLINLVKNLSTKDELEDYLFSSITFPSSIPKIINDCDLILLVLDSTKKRKSAEINLIKKAIANRIPLGIVILQNSSVKPVENNLEQLCNTDLNIFNLLNDNLDERYRDFLTLLIDKSTLLNKQKFKQQTIKTINLYFEGLKKEIWQNIEREKELSFAGKNPDRIQQIIEQLPHKCGRLLQNYSKVFKQSNNQNKINLVNPFFSDSLMYRVQNTIQEAEIDLKKEDKKTYLSLIYKYNNETKAIHFYVLDCCQKQFNNWLQEEWHNIKTKYNNGGLDRLQKELELEIEPILNLNQDIHLSQPQIEPQLEITNYICLSALENNSKITFDYHYGQSTWFRLLVAIFIGTVIFAFTQRLFGFILLFVQIINLFTGQDAKAIKLRQQTKEVKRIVDGKYQFLIRFLTDRITQDMASCIDKIVREYQEQIDIISQIANSNLQNIKQDINFKKEEIQELKRIHLIVQNIFSS